MTITGNGFSPGAEVKFGESTASNVVVVSATTITASTPPGSVGSVNVFVKNLNGQSGSLFKGFFYEETVLLEDDFNDNSLNLAKWSANNLFSGFTDASLPAREISGQFQIGPLLQGQSGSHYNGIRTANTFDFTGAYGYIQLVQGPASSTKADAMFTIGRDAHNYYRIYVEEGVFICQARIGGTKRNLFTAPYDPAVHRYWRIWHDPFNGNVLFDTATNDPSLFGDWVSRYFERWDTAAIPVGAVLLEIKAGTWQPEPIVPGTVIFDNFRLAKP